jgi:L-ascorbate metabolism protein UlaG (beta-lactamase superfamily)
MPRSTTRRRACLAIFAGLFALLAAPARAADNERCPRLVSEIRPLAVPAALKLAAVAEGEVRLTFVGHSTFLIESPAGVKIATDYNDHVRPALTPDIVTMNRAHSTHYSEHPDPEIKYVLRGWGENGAPARHDLKYEDVWIRNVTTNIRDWDGGTMLAGNSMFVFEVAGLCIAHFGHLHHTLTQEHLDQLGRIDVVLVPVDGSYTLGIDGMIEVLKAIEPRLIIPMHIFGPGTLARFVDKIRAIYPVDFGDTASIVLTRAKLPGETRMLVLPGR